jgi:hypothetical protein
MEKAISAAALFIWMLMLAVFPSPGGKSQPGDAQKQAESGKDMVYVCACLKTKSCSCMTEAKTPGPCACGTQGGPPLKAVAHDSAWARENRDALAK